MGQIRPGARRKRLRRSLRCRTPRADHCQHSEEERSMADTVHLGSGKVREIFELDEDRLLLVASDRISTFDVVLPSQIPDKGRVLTGLSAFWFARTHAICRNHLLAVRPDGRSTECR